MKKTIMILTIAFSFLMVAQQGAKAQETSNKSKMQK